MLRVAEGKKKIKGRGGRCVRAVRVCVSGGGCRGGSSGLGKETGNEGWLQETGQESLFSANFELSFRQPLEHEN